MVRFCTTKGTNMRTRKIVKQDEVGQTKSSATRLLIAAADLREAYFANNKHSAIQALASLQNLQSAVMQSMRITAGEVADVRDAGGFSE